jgi:hypothetical protein
VTQRAAATSGTGAGGACLYAFSDALAGDPGVRVAVGRPHELAAVAVAELRGDDMVGQPEDVQRVPAEAVARDRV